MTTLPNDGRRRDAVRNRERLLDAAAALVAERGTEVDVREIARRAGLGMGTLYRHFPTKHLLLDAALDRAFSDWARAARNALTGEPWTDLTRFLDDALARQADHRGLLEGYGRSPDHDHCRHRLHPVIAELVGRAQVAGLLRTDVTTEDVSLLVIALGRIAPLAPQAWRRPLQVALDGLRAAATSPTPLPGPPLGRDELDAALTATETGRAHDSRGRHADPAGARRLRPRRRRPRLGPRA